MLKAQMLKRDVGSLSLRASPTLSDRGRQHVTKQGPPSLML